LKSEGRTDGRSQGLTAKLRKEHQSHSPFLPLVVARAGAVAPHNNVSPRGDKATLSLPQSIRGVTLRQEGGVLSQVPVSLTSQPLEDGTNCAAVGVISLCGMSHDSPWACC
jgi:hypothetical protein